MGMYDNRGIMNINGKLNILECVDTYNICVGVKWHVNAPSNGRAIS